MHRKAQQTKTPEGLKQFHTPSFWMSVHAAESCPGYAREVDPAVGLDALALTLACTYSYILTSPIIFFFFILYIVLPKSFIGRKAKRREFHARETTVYTILVVSGEKLT